ncbi:MAG: hypothetical protein CL886_09170 [Dehalococcoidia bacterium]|nr:hypothetical protein [Dehalococcoidia bacterium]|tara:strand:- start:383 stop:1141 length:759 start_codon:yes stop_codon:yes gene_type:complete
MAETLTIDNTPQTEVVGELTAEEQDSLAVGEKLESDQAELLAGKFKDAEELEKAYIELQSKLGKDGEETPEVEATDESKDEEPDSSDILERLWDQAKAENLQESTIEELSKMDPKALAQMHLEYRANNNQDTITDQQVTQLKEIAGGEKDYESMMGWAQNSLNKEEIDMYDTVMERGDPLSCFFAVQAMKYRYDDESGTEGRMLTGKAASNEGGKFKSQAQVIEAMNDPRYERDPAYRKEVADKLERSDVKF